METPRKLPCGCCTKGCICEEHAKGGIMFMCAYHAIQEEFENDMRLVFGNRVQEDGL